jgi:hypothetical protein
MAAVPMPYKLYVVIAKDCSELQLGAPCQQRLFKRVTSLMQRQVNFILMQCTMVYPSMHNVMHTAMQRRLLLSAGAVSPQKPSHHERIQQQS